MQTRGPVDIPWFNRHAAERPLFSSDKFPPFQPPISQPSPLSGPLSLQSGAQGASTAVSGSSNSSHNAKGFASSTGVTGGSQHQLSVEGPGATDHKFPTQTPSRGSSQSHSGLNTMNQTQPYMDVHSSHFSSPQSYASQSATAGALVPYSHYQQQPPVLQPGSTAYPSTANSYSQYGYANGVTSTQSTTQPPTTSIPSQIPGQLLPLPGKDLPIRLSIVHDYYSHSFLWRLLTVVIFLSQL